MSKKLAGNRRDFERNKVARKIECESTQPETEVTLLSHPSVRNQGGTRGRPRTISDTELGARRSGIKLVLEDNWGDIAWQCMHSRMTEDIRKAFAFLPHNNSTSGSLIECLIRPSFENATGTKVLQARKKHWGACGVFQAFGEQCLELTKAVDQINRAKRELLSETSSKLPLSREAAENLRYIEGQISKNEREAEHLKGERDKALAMADGLYQELELYESAFARNEVLDFLRSKRYKLNPKNFASAIAGLPYMSWRQSMNRTAKLAKQSEGWPTRPAYYCFLAFEYMLQNRRPRSWESVATFLNKEIPKLPKRHHNAKAELIENRPWLREALVTLKREPIVTRKLPFVLSTAFWTAVVRPKTDLDNVLAARVMKEGKLTLS